MRKISRISVVSPAVPFSVNYPKKTICLIDVYPSQFKLSQLVCFPSGGCVFPPGAFAPQKGFPSGGFCSAKGFSLRGLLLRKRGFPSGGFCSAKGFSLRGLLLRKRVFPPGAFAPQKGFSLRGLLLRKRGYPSGGPLLRKRGALTI
jgi:hypothetical protein